MGISHDLRTPVALIKGYTEALTDGVVTDIDSITNSLSIIHSKADQLENMINDLINYMKLNSTDWRQTLELVEIIKNNVPEKYKREKHPARKVFQAIRIVKEIMNG